MALEIRPYREEDVAGMLKVWNEVVEGGEAFPQIEPLTHAEAEELFAAQTLSVVADLDGRVMGLYVLRPNDVGTLRARGQCELRRGVERARSRSGPCPRGGLARAGGAQGLPRPAAQCRGGRKRARIRLCEGLGFAHVGTIPGGFANFMGDYEDVRIYYKSTVPAWRAC